jgi:4-amino-4-deoxy-L-arabinose transferase-like glycosyltransferase
MRRWPLWLFICSLTLRLISLGASLLWYDEAFTAAVVKLPLLRMLSAIQGDVHPPLWYLIDWVMTRLLGSSEFALRLPSALFGTAAVLVMYNLVKKSSGEVPARWASGLMAVMPGQLYYSQEARMYSLLTLLVLLGAQAVIERKWLRLALCCVLLLYTQNFGVLYSGVLAAWGLWQSKGKALVKMAAASLAYAPWAVTALHQVKIVSAGFWVPPPGNVGGALYFLSYTTLFERLPQVLIIHGAALSVVLTITSLICLRKDLRAARPLLALAFLPPAVLYVLSIVWHPVLVDRILLPSGAAIVALWGMGLSKLPVWAHKPFAAVALPMLVIALGSFYVDPGQQRQRADPVVTIVNAGWQDKDAVYHIALDSLIAYDYRLPGKPAFVLPEAGDLAQSLSDPTKQALGIKQREILPDRLAEMGYKRIWLFVDETPVSSDNELAEADRLLEVYPTIRRWQIVNSKMVKFRVVLLKL